MSEWKMVPVEPTEDMLVAGQEAWLHKRRSRPAMEDCEEAGELYRAMLVAAPAAPPVAAPGQSEERWSVAPLKWSEERSPNKECSYDHVIAETPFGRILVSWKGWKEYPTFTVDESPLGFDCLVASSVTDAKREAERMYREAIMKTLAAPPAPVATSVEQPR